MGIPFIIEVLSQIKKTRDVSVSGLASLSNNPAVALHGIAFQIWNTAYVEYTLLKRTASWGVHPVETHSQANWGAQPSEAHSQASWGAQPEHSLVGRTA